MNNSMTPERAIEIIKDELPYESSVINEALTIIEKAIGYRTPKKPTHPFKYCLNNQCPVCGDWDWSTYGTAKWKPNFCPNCGQALDWSDEECANG